MPQLEVSTEVNVLLASLGYELRVQQDADLHRPEGCGGRPVGKCLLCKHDDLSSSSSTYGKAEHGSTHL